MTLVRSSNALFGPRLADQGWSPTPEGTKTAPLEWVTNCGHAAAAALGLPASQRVLAWER
jgi:hypothetical protein